MKWADTPRVIKGVYTGHLEPEIPQVLAGALEFGPLLSRPWTSWNAAVNYVEICMSVTIDSQSVRLES